MKNPTPEVQMCLDILTRDYRDALAEVLGAKVDMAAVIHVTHEGNQECGGLMISSTMSDIHDTFQMLGSGSMKLGNAISSMMDERNNSNVH